MKYKMFLDDIRDPPLDGSDWVVVRSYNEAVETIKLMGFPVFISFDHDLNEEKTGKDFANHIIELDLEHNIIPEDFSFYVHSANPIGKQNIASIMQGYLDFKKPNKADSI